MTWIDCQGQVAWIAAKAQGRSVVLRLPYPPTANNLFAPITKRSRKTGKTVHTKRKTAEAKTYAEEVWYHVRSQRGHRGFTGPLAVLICATPPDARRRDVANIEKAATDAIVAAGVMIDDSQVRDLRLVWAASAYGDTAPAGPRIEVSVRELLPHELGLMPKTPKAPRTPKVSNRHPSTAVATVESVRETTGKNNESRLPVSQSLTII